jgi:hypothetical protein
MGATISLNRFGVVPICRALSAYGVQIAPRTYWARRSRPPSQRSVTDAALTEILAEIHEPGPGGRRPPECLAVQLAVAAEELPVRGHEASLHGSGTKTDPLPPGWLLSAMVIQHVAVEFPCCLPQSLASSSVAVCPACAVLRRKSASSWSSASPYSAQIWSIEVFIPE